MSRGIISTFWYWSSNQKKATSHWSTKQNLSFLVNALEHHHIFWYGDFLIGDKRFILTIRSLCLPKFECKSCVLSKVVVSQSGLFCRLDRCNGLNLVLNWLEKLYIYVFLAILLTCYSWIKYLVSSFDIHFNHNILLNSLSCPVFCDDNHPWGIRFHYFLFLFNPFIFHQVSSAIPG